MMTSGGDNERRPFRGGETPGAYEEGTLKPPEVSGSDNKIKKRYLEMTESDKYFFNHIKDFPQISIPLAVFCLLLNAAMMVISGIGTILAAVCS